MTVTIETMTHDDLPAAMTIWANAEGVGLSEGDELESLRFFLDRNPGLSVAARAGEQMVGAVLCGHDGRRGFLYHLAVVPEYQRRGIGRRLVDTCLASLGAIGVAKCSIFLYADNESGKSFWKQNGWSSRHDLEVMQRRLGAQSA